MNNKNTDFGLKKLRILTDVEEPRVAKFWRDQTELWSKKPQ